MILTPLRGLLVPWVFRRERGDYDSYGKRWFRLRVMRLLGPIWLVVVPPEHL